MKKTSHLSRIHAVTLLVGVPGVLAVLSVLAGPVVSPPFSRGPGAVARAQSDEARRHANRGVALLEQFRFGEAAEAFESVVRLEPDSAAGYVNLGIAYFNERDFEKAHEALERARAIAPRSAHAHYNLGLIHKLQGETEEAVRAFEIVAELDPGDAMTQYYLGTVYANLGRLEEAETSLRRAIHLSPNNESAHFSLGNVLIRQGRREEGRAELLAFRELKESFPAEAASAGLQYTELGPYAEAVEEYAAPLQPPRPERRLERSRVRFVEATAEVGLELEPKAAAPPPAAFVDRSEYDLEWIRAHVLPPLGTGLAFRDLDGDHRPDLVFVRDGAPRLFLNREGRFEPAGDRGLPATGSFVGVVIGDVDNDGDGDVYLTGLGPNALFLNDGAGRFTESEDPTVRGDDVSVSATFADVDHDGDLDLYVCNYVSASPPERDRIAVPAELPGAPNRLYRNNGDGSFTDVAAETRTDGGARRSLGAVFSDLDDDRDVDFVVVNDGAPALVLSNDRVGTFTESSRAWALETGFRTRAVDVADFDRDGDVDVAFTAEGAFLNTLLRGPATDGFLPDVLSPGLLAAGVPGARYGVRFLDADNDTDLDLLLVANEADALVAYYENTTGGFQRAGSLPSPFAGEGRALATADVDGDGDLDVVVASDRGELAYYRNEGGNERAWLTVRARGLRSNLDGLGAKVEIKAGDARLRREVRSTSGYFSQSDLPLHFGLGDAEAADYVRFLWPGGVKQIEMDVAGSRTADIEELNRKGTSCPILYAWDGERIRFVTDFLGGSAFGYLTGPGGYNYPDTDETVKMEAFDLVPRDGHYEMRWVNQLEEVIMYDRASLLVVDHPDDVEVFPNERLLPAPPYPEPRLYAVRRARTPERATDHRGRDVTERIRGRDRVYADGFDRLPFKGYAELHQLTLSLGELEPDKSYALLLYGWVDYADSSSNLAASQAGLSLRPPFLEVSDEGGRFEMGLEQMGFPAGLPKTMLVDLTGVVGTDRNVVRITTNMRLYWDDIRVAEIDPDAELTVTELSASSAELRFVGYPEPFAPDGHAPTLYTYDAIRPAELWGTHEGFYTRYGDVRELLETVDDRYVVARHGDEIILRFDASAVPRRAEGRTRSFFAFSDGFGKDMDLNSARPHTVEPLPFHGMTAYPYPEEEAYPGTERHRRYLETYNTRYFGPEAR